MIKIIILRRYTLFTFNETKNNKKKKSNKYYKYVIVKIVSYRINKYRKKRRYFVEYLFNNDVTVVSSM